MLGFISLVKDRLHETVNPSYKREIEEAKQQLHSIGLVSTALLVASIAFGIFGMALIASGGFHAAIGAKLILVSLPLGYLSFNVYKVNKNMSDILDNYKEYTKLTLFSLTLNERKFKEKIKQGTLCFSWAVDPIVSDALKTAVERV